MPARDLPEHPTKTRHSRLIAEREQDIYQAVLSLLREVGYDALTMDEVAGRARVTFPS